MQEFIALANSLADKAGEITKKYFRQPFDVEHKADASPVTIADREIEAMMREEISRARPHDTILGEEYGIQQGDSGLTWVLDPIDGTKSFMIGRPTFGTLIALCEDNLPVLGVIDQAILGERWLGVKGMQTTFNGQPVRTRKCVSVHDASVGATTPMMFDEIPDFGRAYRIFEQNQSRMIWGADCYMYGLIANGYMDIAFEQNLKAHDFAALVPIIEGAGGHISDWRGDPLTLNSAGKVVAVGDKELWPEVERLIRRSPY